MARKAAGASRVAFFSAQVSKRMIQPSPAIVAQDAVLRLPRWVLWLCCIAYVLAGSLGREPWRHPDLSAYGVMSDIASGQSTWMAPTLAQIQPETDALLPYWLGAAAIKLGSPWIEPALAARLPFMALLLITLIAVWYGAYHLARSARAQPVAFAFGGEAQPVDYARALADGAMLACIACLGLAQLSHETTPALTQLCASATLFYSVAALPSRHLLGGLLAGLSLFTLTLSGAPTLSFALGAGAGLLYLALPAARPEDPGRPLAAAWTLLALAALSAGLAHGLDLWRWRLDGGPVDADEWRSWGQLLIWFTWPAGPLVLWALWKWRRQWMHWHEASAHVVMPLWFVLVCMLSALLTPNSERSLLLALPAMAALAAFALPTLRRSVAALIDWFTLVFFTGCAVVIWVVWLSMQTGVPAQPARNVARLAPGFVHEFSWTLFLLALIASLSWIGLIRWRIGRHRTALWKSLALPAGGAVTCWVLLMTLWLPLLDYARSYQPLVAQAQGLIGKATTCVSMQGLKQSQIAALQAVGGYRMQALSPVSDCSWLIVNAPAAPSPTPETASAWQLQAAIGHPAIRDEKLFVYRR